MWTGPLLNWWTYGAPDVVPPSSDFWNARTGDSSLQGGEIDLKSIFIIFILGTLIC